MPRASKLESTLGGSAKSENCMWYILSGRFVNPEKTIFPRAYDDENPTVALTVCCIGAANEGVYTRFSENARPPKGKVKDER
jgi:hypothetical protein